MKMKILAALLAISLLAAFSIPAAAQAGFAKIQGTAVDENGQPIVGATVELTGKENGQHYKFTTDKKGNFFSLGISSGIYKAVLSKDGQQLWVTDNYQVSLAKDDSLNFLNFNLAKEKKAAQAEMTEEQKAKIAEVQKHNSLIKNLNAMLAQATTAMQAGNFDEAITTMKQAIELSPERDLLWGKLAEAYLAAAKKGNGPDKAEKFQSCLDAYQKAIDLAKAAPPDKPNTNLPAYYNNYGECLANTGKTAEAMASYENAIKLDAAGAGRYYFNMGATMVNSNKMDEALSAFDKAIAADPTRADAYYYKGLALIGKSTLQGDKMIAPPGTAEAFNKYLEMQPDGPLAEQAKMMISSIGATVETSFGKGKKKK